MMKTKSHNRLMRILSLPVRVLSRARDFYVRSMTDYADRVGYGNLGCPGGHYPALPRSFSVSVASRSNENDDLKELIRAASARRFGDRIDVDAMLRKAGAGSSKVMALPKSCSVGMGRIDEDEPCEFEGEGVGKVKGGGDLLYPRSRSCAVGSRTNGFGIGSGYGIK